MNSYFEAVFSGRGCLQETIRCVTLRNSAMVAQRSSLMSIHTRPRNDEREDCPERRRTLQKQARWKSQAEGCCLRRDLATKKNAGDYHSHQRAERSLCGWGIVSRTVSVSWSFR
jgi:hypothetical protein